MMSQTIKPDPDFLDELPLWSAPFGLLLLSNIPYKKNITVLDIGTGTGFPLTEIAMRLGDTCKLYGIDPWTSALERVRKKLNRYDIKNVELINGKAEHIPLAKESVDLIVSNNGTNNVEDLFSVFRECARVIKPDGKFLQTYNLETSMSEFYMVLEKVLLENQMKEAVGAVKEHIYIKRKPLGEFTEMLGNTGFRVVRVIEQGFDYTFNDGASLFNHYFIRLAFLESWKATVTAEKQQYIFNKVKNEINSIAEDKGCFKISIPYVLIDSIRISD